MTEQLLTAKQAAEFLQIHVKTVYRLAKLKRIPSINVGGAVRFRPRDLERIGGR